ncbi:hypothetical protein BG910_08830 [Neisseria chenwenguii]|uniref:Uncharacterized protein n=1 Tax=Neisseria chenwenguii TaxID=1853278 RepID=A0A220S2W2_9NEIS|nr:hypothetical protein BG910_08830 [Neisseria chenwenguii]
MTQSVKGRLKTVGIGGLPVSAAKPLPMFKNKQNAEIHTPSVCRRVVSGCNSNTQAVGAHTVNFHAGHNKKAV